MRLFYIIILSALVGCYNKPKKIVELKINEVAFAEDSPNKLEYIEIYNPNNISITIDTLDIIINNKKYTLKTFDTIPGNNIFFEKLDVKINNKEYNIILELNNQVVDEFSWKHYKTKPYVGRFPDGSNIISAMSYRSLGKTNNVSILQLPKPKFNFSSGFYTKKINLKLASELSHLPLYFTLDGSNPNKASKLYNDSIIISKNSVVKARFIIGNHKSPCLNFKWRSKKIVTSRRDKKSKKLF